MVKRVLAWFLLPAAVSLFAAGGQEKIAADAELLESSLSAAEDAFRDGLGKSDMIPTRAAIAPAMEKIGGASMRLGRAVRFRGHAGCDGALVYRWGYANDLANLLSRSICGERPMFALQLENNCSADAATFAKNCISVDLQLPNRMYSAKTLPKRAFGAYQDNLAVFTESGKGKTIVISAMQWSSRVRLAEFYFWAVRKNAAMVREDAESLGRLPEFLLRQLDDAKKLVCCTLHFPRGSAPAMEFSRKMALIRTASGLLATHARRSGKPELARKFADASKLDPLVRHWAGASPFYFYWSEVDLAGLGDQAQELLNAQIPCDPAYFAEQEKAAQEKAAQEKEGKKSRGRKGKKKDDAALVRSGWFDRIAGEDGGGDGEADGGPDGGPGGGPDGGPGGGPDGGPGGGGKAKGKTVSFEDAIKEYNLQRFEENGPSRRNARTAARFKQEMTEFARLLSSLAGSVEEFRTAFPDALGVPTAK